MAPIQYQKIGGARGEINIHKPIIDIGKEPIIEHFHTPGNIGNILSWGDQQILELVHEVENI